MASNVFGRCIIYDEECPPYCNEIADVREDIIAALGFDEKPEITESTVADVEVPGLDSAPRGARLFSKIFGFGIRAILRFATGNLTAQLLTLYKKIKINEREHLALYINGTLKRLPVIDAYCLLVISMIAKTDAPWDKSCREARAHTLIESQKKLKQMATEAMALMTNIDDVEYPRYQQTCEHYPTLDDMWQIYDGIARFFKSMMAMIVHFERNDRLESEPQICARCRKPLFNDDSYDITIEVKKNQEFTRRFTNCTVCQVNFVGLTRVTSRQKRPRNDDDDGEPAPRATKKPKESMRTHLNRVRCRVESLRLLLEQFDH